MTSPVKFTFDTNFDGGAKTDFEEEVSRLKQLVDDTRDKAMQDGLAQGRAEMLESIEQQAIGAMGAIQHSCLALLEKSLQLEAATKRDAVQLATLISGRLAPALLNARPEGEIEELIMECFTQNHDEKRLVIRIADCLTEQLEPRIKAMQKANDFPGEVVVISDPHLPQSDCHIEWQDGGVERDGRKLMGDIEETVNRYIEHIYNPDKVADADTTHDTAAVDSADNAGSAEQNNG